MLLLRIKTHKNICILSNFFCCHVNMLKKMFTALDDNSNCCIVLHWTIQSILLRAQACLQSGSETLREFV